MTDTDKTHPLTPDAEQQAQYWERHSGGQVALAQRPVTIEEAARRATWAAPAPDPFTVAAIAALKAAGEGRAPQPQTTVSTALDGLILRGESELRRARQQRAAVVADDVKRYLNRMAEGLARARESGEPLDLTQYFGRRAVRHPEDSEKATLKALEDLGVTVVRRAPVAVSWRTLRATLRAVQTGELELVSLWPLRVERPVLLAQLPPRS